MLAEARGFGADSVRAGETEDGAVELSGKMLGPFGILTRLEYWGFRLVAGVFGALPLDVASDLSGWIWRKVAPRLRRHARADRNLSASIPELTAEQRAVILDQMWDMLGRTFAEAFHLDRIFTEPGRLQLEIPPDVQEAFRSDRGCVIACLHQGNWEVASMAAVKGGARIAGVYQRLKNPLVDRYVTRMRAPYYPQGLFTKGNDAVLKLRRVLRRGDAVALLADLREHRGVAVPFFGRPAPSTPFPAFLARADGAPLIAGRVIRLKGARFRVTAEILPVATTDDRHADVEATTATLHACFERFIRENPGQWMWGHRRWG
ncbi:lysophospholipid acyltransferase family protein [Alsobacter soli]|uniref:lysophospholipid acyltransferase family protein n=1 Tax=Alsobacter soli TaxID=2109933 RepID=UPI001AECDF25|nr:lysophospholipid acyltransferase family protein [Alsobacter soli]